MAALEAPARAAVEWEAAEGGGYPRPPPENHAPMAKKFSNNSPKASGGRFFEVSKKETLDKIYASLDEELRSQYVLGYSPDKPDATPGYHKLHLAVKQKTPKSKPAKASISTANLSYKM